MKIEPNKRFVLDPLRICNLRCRCCYYIQSCDKWNEYNKPLAWCKNIINLGKMRGNDAMCITGGEPTMYKYLTECIDYAHAQGLKVEIITNGVVTKSKADKLIKHKLDEILITRNGLKDAHNYMCNNNTAYQRQVKFINQIKKSKIKLRFNVVITKFNQDDLLRIVKELNKYNPIMINFINMNLHHEWKHDDLNAKKVIANLKIVEPILNETIEYLESKKIGIAVRYYPMCRIAEKNRKYIVNDLQVSYDPWEWDYPRSPKTIEHYRQYSVNELTNKIEEKGEPCCDCDLQWICGGIHSQYHIVSREIFGEICEAQKLDFSPYEKYDEFYYMRQK